jgi:hypothetical protein
MPTTEKPGSSASLRPESISAIHNSVGSDTGDALFIRYNNVTPPDANLGSNA